ncbi:gag-pol fusion protein [Sugiyamaella lignohabitans]|uniref:Gag-pol fusion protein n=1 Tax=Sugiyamaella lignohabitans TaxID=796027 RepID=A0A167F8H2_9ASCO|nr:gag-pol fusion protein [Sugiyamaella lignohabitans]ANB14953.1 gag-pol fusion protein [Sugiyamaella lignohabitans]
MTKELAVTQVDSLEGDTAPFLEGMDKNKTKQWESISHKHGLGNSYSRPKTESNPPPPPYTVETTLLWLRRAKRYVAYRERTQSDADVATDIISLLPKSDYKIQAIHWFEQEPYPWENLWTLLEKQHAQATKNARAKLLNEKCNKISDYPEFLTRKRVEAQHSKLDEDVVISQLIAAVQNVRFRQELERLNSEHKDLTVDDFVRMATLRAEQHVELQGIGKGKSTKWCSIHKSHGHNTKDCSRQTNKSQQTRNPQSVKRPVEATATSQKSIQSVAFSHDAEMINRINQSLEKDPKYSKILQHFRSPQHSPFPGDKKDKLCYSYRNDILCYLGKIVVGVDEDLRENLIKLFHDHWIGGHHGIRRTRQTLTEVFTWPHISEYVEKYVKSCLTCQKFRIRNHAPYGLLEPLPIPDRPFQSISLDFVTSLPESGPRKSTQVLVIVDCFSKYVQCYPCSTNTNAIELATCMKDYFDRFGRPDTIISDRGTQFTSNFWRSFTASRDIKLQFSAAYHPQTDDQTEPMNREVTRHIAEYIKLQHNDWSELLSEATFAINATYNESIKNSPYKVVFGFEPNIHFNFEAAEAYPTMEAK